MQEFNQVFEEQERLMMCRLSLKWLQQTMSSSSSPSDATDDAHSSSITNNNINNNNSSSSSSNDALFNPSTSPIAAVLNAPIVPFNPLSGARTTVFPS